ncbi:HEAT repeat domain-containing protein [candidate division KSB1 bacterium]
MKIISIMIFAVLLLSVSLCFAQENKAEQILKEKQERVRLLIKGLTNFSIDEDLYETMRAQAANDLGIYKDTSAVMPLIDRLLNDKYTDVRKSSAMSLGLIGDKRAIPALYENLEYKNPRVQTEAATSLIRYFGKGSDEKILSKLESIILGKDMEKWDMTGSYPIHWGTDGEEEAKEKARRIAISILCEIKTARERAIRILESLANDPNEKMREKALQALKNIKK